MLSKIMYVAMSVGFGLLLAASVANAEEARIIKRGVMVLAPFEVEKNGQRTNYEMFLPIKSFEINWQMGILRAGAMTGCEPFLGNLTEDLVIDSDVEESEYLGWDAETRSFKEVVVKLKAPAHLIVKKGSYVYGRCQDQANGMVGITFQPDREPIRVEYYK